MTDLAAPADLWYDASYQHGEYSYYENAKRMPSADYDGMAIGNNPDGTPGDKDGAIVANAIAGLWLPLFLPGDYDGGRTDGKPSVVFYAANLVTGQFDQEFGPVHSSPEADQQRYDKACHLALDSAGYTSGGSPYVREA